MALALTDSSRREIIELLNNNPQGMTTKELADKLCLRIPTVMSHLDILRRSGAITSRRRTGRRVRRVLNRYYSLVQVENAKRIAGAVETAKEGFSNHLVKAVLSFLTENPHLIPATTDPYFLAEWLDTLIHETDDQVATSAVFNCNDYLAETGRYRELAVNVAKTILFNDFLFLLNSYVCDLFAGNPKLVNRIGRRYGRTRVKSEMEITFVVEAMYSLLYDSDENITKARNVLLETISVLPEGQSSQLRRFWPLVLDARNLPEKTKDRIMSFFFWGDESEILERCERNASIIKRFGGNQLAKRGSKM